MINLFKIAENDASLGFLSELFGTMNGLLPDATATSFMTVNASATGIGPSSVGPATAGSASTILSQMFNTFNTVVLAVGALVIVYMTVVGALATAHEGEFMGKKWNNIWIPIRTVLGIATLVPTGSGYSAIQLVMMWIVIQGVGAADTLWSTALTYRALTGSPYKQTVSLPSVGVETTMSQLFSGLVCDASARLAAPNPAGSGVEKGGYFCGENNISWCSTPNDFDPSRSSYTLGPQGQCGTLTYCDASANGSCKDPNSMQCLTCLEQLKSLEQIIPTLAASAQQFVQADYTYRDFYYNSWNQTNNSAWDPIYQYCSSQSIPQTECCVPSNFPGQACQGNAESFPSPNNGDNAANDFRSPSDVAVKNIYWPFMLKDSLEVSPTQGCNAKSFIGASACYYMSNLNAGVTKYMAIAANNSDNLSGAAIGIPGISMPAGFMFQLANNYGWVSGGLFYYVIATSVGNQLRLSSPDFTFVMPQPSGTMADVRTNVDAVSTLLEVAESTQSASATGVTGSVTQESSAVKGKSPKFLKALVKPITAVIDTLNKALTDLLTATAGPLNALQLFGSLMIITAEVTYVVVVALAITLGTVSAINTFVLGTGAIAPTIGAIMFVVGLIAPPFFALLAALIAMGGMLAIYIPLVPYIIFTFGVIGWFVAVIETMVAAPLVALGILSPSGQHELMGKAEPAIGMTFNIFLRPSLMLFGLFAAMLLAIVVVKLIFMTFFFAIMFATRGLALVDPTMLVLTIAALTMIIVSALNKCFQMIYIIPEQVMQWIGFHHGPAGGGAGASSEALEKTKGRVGAAGGRLGAMGSSAASGAKGAAEGTKKSYGDTKKAQKKSQETDIQGGGSGGSG